jgi:hypothetical protein
MENAITIRELIRSLQKYPMTAKVVCLSEAEPVLFDHLYYNEETDTVYLVV